MKLLVIGAGSIGRRHAGNAAKLARTAIFDRDMATARRVADETGAEPITGAEDVWRWGADGVVVATPHRTHLELAAAAVAAGADVLIEKPLSHSLAGTAELIAAAQAAARKLYVVTNMRFHPAVLALRRALPRIGRVLFARAQYGNYLPSMRPGADYRRLYCASREAGGGVILDAIHEIDYLRWLIGPVLAVTAVADKISDLDIDVEDYAALVLTHEGGGRSEIHLDYLQQCKQRGCTIAGTDGTLVWRSEGKAPEHCVVRLFERRTGEWRTLVDDADLDNARPYETLMREFVRALRGEDSRLAPAQEGVAALRVALLALQAAKLKRTLSIGADR